MIVVSSNQDYLDIAISIGADDKLIRPVRYEMLEMTLPETGWIPYPELIKPWKNLV